MAGSFVDLHCHVIFSTKNREPMIEASIQERLFRYIGGILNNERAKLVCAGGVPDHVHLLVSLGKEMSISECVRLIKSNSSRWVHTEHPDLSNFGWQTGYGAFAVSHSNIEAVNRYIASQETHHAQRTFQDEFREFLTRHEIMFDERYIWD